MDKLVAVVIPVYNVEKYLEKSIESVLNQTYKNMEIVLVDDGSLDDCPKICDQYTEKYYFIRVIHKKNGGLSSARNAGMKLLAEDENKPEYLLFLDSDDQLDKNALTGMIQAAEQYGADMVFPDRYYKVSEKTGKISLARLFPSKLYCSAPKEFALDVLIANGCAWRATSVIYRFALLQKRDIAFPEGRIAEDFSFNMKVLQYAEKIRIYPFATLYCTRRENSLSQSFHPDFLKDILYIDQVARKFLADTGKKDKKDEEKADSLLCRLATVQMISAMSHKNPTSYKQKKQYCMELVNHESICEIIRGRKYSIPYFSSAFNQIAIGMAYFMFRYRLDNIAFWLFSLI